MNQIRYFIGANNKTGRVEQSKVETILDRYFPGYNIVPSTGRYKGQSECSINISIFDNVTDLDTAKGIANELKTDLDQESIILDYNQNIHFI